MFDFPSNTLHPPPLGEAAWTGCGVKTKWGCTSDMRKSLTKFLALSLALLYLVGCGGSSAPAAGGSSGGDKKPVKIKLASISPLSTGPVPQGTSIRNGAQLAVDERKAELEKAGFQVEFLPKDDTAKPDVGAQVAADLMSDKEVVGIVGTLMSGVAKAVMPRIKDSGLVMVSPSNTAIELTESGYTNFNRVCFRDDAQGAAGAIYAFKQLGVKSVWLIHDKSAYGQGLVEQFKQNFVKLGGTVLGTSPTDDKTTDFGPVITDLQTKNPDMIYYGGYAQAGGLLIKQVRAKGVQAKMMAGDGWDDSDLFKYAGEAINGVYYTSLDVDLSADSSKKFIEAYKKVAGKDPESYAFYAYDSAMLIINAVIEYGKANPGKVPDRAEIAKLVRNTKGYKGVVGEVTLDAKGDNPVSKPFMFQYGADGKGKKLGIAPVS